MDVASLLRSRDEVARIIQNLQANPRYWNAQGAHAIAVRQRNLANIETQLSLAQVAQHNIATGGPGWRPSPALVLVLGGLAFLLLRRRD